MGATAELMQLGKNRILLIAGSGRGSGASQISFAGGADGHFPNDRVWLKITMCKRASLKWVFQT